MQEATFFLASNASSTLVQHTEDARLKLNHLQLEFHISLKVQTPDKDFEDQHASFISDVGCCFPRLQGTACTRYGSLSSPYGGAEAGHDVSFCLLSRRNNWRRLNYGNYWIDSDEADVDALPLFVIYDATVTQAASIKDYMNVNAYRRRRASIC